MRTNDLVGFLCWATLTFSWLSTNFFFIEAISNTIKEHNEEIRRQAIEEYEDNGEDEGKNKSKDD